MRNFINARVFDDTVAVADGQMETGTGVPLDPLKQSMDDGFRRKRHLPPAPALDTGGALIAGLNLLRGERESPG